MRLTGSQLSILFEHITLANVFVFLTFGQQKLLFQEIFVFIQPMKGLGGVRGRKRDVIASGSLASFFITTVFGIFTIEKYNSFLPVDMKENMGKTPWTARFSSGMLFRL